MKQVCELKHLVDLERLKWLDLANQEGIFSSKVGPSKASLVISIKLLITNCQNVAPKKERECQLVKVCFIPHNSELIQYPKSY
jgi:hypothetical protein